MWWESVCLVRKLAVAVACTFLGTDNASATSNVLTCMAILFVARVSLSARAGVDA
jgi:hypothetical protein